MKQILKVSIVCLILLVITISIPTNAQIFQRLDSIVTQRINDLNEWENLTKGDFVYDLIFKDSISISYNWNSISNRWEPLNRTENVYHKTGDIAYSIKNLMDSVGNDWKPYNKDIYHYDLSGKLSSKISQIWNENNSAWEFELKYVYAYNDSSKIDSILSYSWDNDRNDWTVSGKILNEYNSSYKIDSVLSYKWDIDSNKLVVSGKIENTYNSSSNLVIKTNYNWIEDSTLVPERYKDTGWKPIWMPENKSEYSYDGNQNLLIYTYFVWNIKDSIWNENIIQQNSYNNSYSFHDLVLPKSLAENDDSINLFNHMLTSKREQYISSSIEERSIYYYSSDSITAIDQNRLLINSIRIYPNPSSDYIITDWDGVMENSLFELYNMEGVNIFKQQIFKGEKVFIDQIPNGIYIYRITDGRTGSVVGKVVIK